MGKGPEVEQSRPLGDAAKRPGQSELGEEHVGGGAVPGKVQGWARTCSHTEEIAFGREGQGTRDGFEQRAKVWVTKRC